jgi:GMP synthase-like glutamine amidotransferase
MASGSVTPIQMIKHETKTIYGVQFHPETPGEFLSTPQGWKLLSNFAKISKAETVPVPLPPNGRKVFPY